MRDAFVQTMDRMPSEALRVYLYLQHRARLDTKIGVTQQEISRATRLSVGAVRESLGWLVEPTYKDALLKAEPILPYIKITKTEKAHAITLLEPYEDTLRLHFTFEDTDSRRVAVLEKEIRRLAKTRGEKSDLSLYIKGDRASLLSEIESDLGRPLTQSEAFLMGGVLHHFGVDRVRSVWRRQASNMEKPIVGIYALFMNNAKGASVVEKEPRKEVSYRPFERTEELV